MEPALISGVCAEENYIPAMKCRLVADPDHTDGLCPNIQELSIMSYIVLPNIQLFIQISWRYSLCVKEQKRLERGKKLPIFLTKLNEFQMLD